MWLMVEELEGRIVAGSPTGFPESSGKTSHNVFHSRSILAKSVCTLAWNEEVVKVIEALGDQCVVGRNVGGSKGLNMVCKLAAFNGVGSSLDATVKLEYEDENVLVSGSAEPVGGTLGWRKGKWMKPRSTTFSDMLKLCVSEMSELTERQLFTQTGNKMEGDEVSCEISKLCAGQATKSCG